MKKINQKLKSFLVVLLMAITIASAPYVVLAKDGNHEGKNNEVKVENSTKINSNNSIWSRVFGNWFEGKSKTSLIASTEPNISGITAPTILNTGQVGTWTVQASDSQNGSLSYAVDWGEKSPFSLFTKMASPNFVQTSTFSHAYAKAGTYTVKFTVSNESGASTTGTATVRVLGRSIQVAPIISNLTVKSDKPHKAIITWNTDVRANSLVWFSKTSPVDTSGKPVQANMWRFGKTLNHKIELGKLEANTKYYVVVGSANGAGMTLSSEASFTTPATTDKQAPVIKSLTGPKEVKVGEKVTVTVNAFDPNNGSLSYSADWGENPTMTKTALMAQSKPIFVQTATFNHIYLEAGTYKATFTAENSLGKKVSSSLEITVKENSVDTTAPVIAPHSNLVIDATGVNGAVVNYTAPQVTDNVDATTTATCSPASGSTFAIGNTTVFCNYTDTAGNPAVQTSFVVTINPEL